MQKKQAAPNLRFIECPRCGHKRLREATVMSVAAKLAVSKAMVAEKDRKDAYQFVLDATRDERTCPNCDAELTGPEVASMAARISNGRRKKIKGPPARMIRCRWCRKRLPSSKLKDHRPRCSQMPEDKMRLGRPAVDVDCRFCRLHGPINWIKEHENADHAKQIAREEARQRREIERRVKRAQKEEARRAKHASRSRREESHAA